MMRKLTRLDSFSEKLLKTRQSSHKNIKVGLNMRWWWRTTRGQVVSINLLSTTEMFSPWEASCRGETLKWARLSGTVWHETVIFTSRSHQKARKSWMLRVQKHHELWSTSEAPSTSVWFLFLRFIKTSVSVLPFFSCFVKTTWRFKSQRELIPILQLLPANWAWLNHERDEEWNIPGLANRLKWNHVKAANLNCGRSGIIWSLKDTRGNLLPLKERPRRAGRAPTRWQIIEEGNLRQTPAEQGSWGGSAHPWSWTMQRLE